MGSQTQVFNIFPGRCGSGPSRRLLLCNARDAGTLRQQAYPAGECNVKDAVYKVTEVVGTSTKGIEDAIQRAIPRTAKTVHPISWFAVAEMRCHVAEGQIERNQVQLKIGFTLPETTHSFLFTVSPH